MKSLTGICVFLVTLLPALSLAADFGINGTTLFRFEERSVPGFDKQRVVPATQFLGIDSTKLADGNLSVHLYGWGRVDLADKSTSEGTTEGDIAYAYLQYRFPKANGEIKAGRLFVYEGVATEQIDGMIARTDLAGGGTIALFGGAPVKLDRDSRSKGDYIAGGRLSYRLAGIMEIGASGLQEGRVPLNAGSTDDRQLVGGDIWLSPHKTLELNGRTTYNASTSGVAEHSYLLSIRPVGQLTIAGEYNEHDFKDYFAFSNIRSLFNPDLGDKVRNYGGSVTYAIAKPAEVTAGYKRIHRDSKGNSDRYGAELRLTLLDNKLRSGGSYYRAKGAGDINSYHEVRGYVLYDPARYFASLDAIGHFFDTSIFGRKEAYEVVASAGYRFRPDVALSGDLSYGENPQYTEELRGVLRLTFTFNTASKGAGK